MHAGVYSAAPSGHHRRLLVEPPSLVAGLVFKTSGAARERRSGGSIPLLYRSRRVLNGAGIRSRTGTRAFQTSMRSQQRPLGASLDAVENKAIDWEGLASDDGRSVHILCRQCPVEEAAAQVIARVLANYGARTDLTTWRFELRPYPPTPQRAVVHFRADEDGAPVFGI